MTKDDLLVELDRYIAGADAAQRVAWLVALAGRVLSLGASIGPQDDAEWTPLEAGQAVGVSSARIKVWARRRSADVWAHRLSRKCLRIRKSAFLEWHGTSDRESSPKRPEPGANARESQRIGTSTGAVRS